MCGLMAEIGQIERGIPIPADGRGKGERRKYPLDKMRIGDSILIPRNSRQVLYHFQVKHPEFKFTARREGKNFRVWRIASK